MGNISLHTREEAARIKRQADLKRAEDEAREKLRVIDWDMHIGFSDRRQCARYVDLFNKLLVATPDAKSLQVNVGTERPSKLVFACVSTAARRAGFKAELEEKKYGDFCDFPGEFVIHIAS